MNPANQIGRSSTPNTSANTENASFKPYTLWGLNESEWHTYQKIMQGPLGYRNPSLEPPLALAHAAQSEEETRRYLRIFIETTDAIWERGKVLEALHREERFRMYPNVLPMDQDILYQDENTVRAGDRFLFITRASCTTCQQTASTLVTATKVFDNSFDIFVQDASTDEQLVEWASATLKPHQLEDGRVTLNASDPYLSDHLPTGRNWAFYVRRGDRLFPANAFEALTN